MRKEFRYSVGYYYQATPEGNVLVWHKCSNKFRYFSDIDFFFIRTNPKSVCPYCGEPVLRWETMSRDYFLNFKDVALIRIDTAGLKIGIGFFISQYDLHTDSKVFKKTARYARLTINLKTGCTYSLREVSLTAKDGFSGKKSVVNISYQGTPHKLPPDALGHVHNIIREKIKQVHGEDVPAFESYGVELSLDNLIRYVRCPFICPVLYHRILHWSRQGRLEREVLPKEVSVKNDCRDPIQQMLQQSKIPQVKSLRRIVFNDEEGFPLLLHLSYSFRNVDIIRSLYYAYTGCCSSGDGAYVDFSAKVFKALIRHKGEKVIANKLISLIKHNRQNAYEILRDLIRDYNRLDPNEFDLDKYKDIDELHLNVATKVAQKEKENRKIEYSPYELSLKTSDEMFSILPAKDTYELIEVGKKMKICVGAYGETAVAKRCSIFVLRDLDEYKPVGCIELRDKTITQAKGVCNQPLKKPEKEFVEKWIKDKGLKNITSDLRRFTAEANEAYAGAFEQQLLQEWQPV